LKINPNLLADPALNAAVDAQAGTPAGKTAAGHAAAVRPQVDLMADGNIKLLLDALGKTLGRLQQLGSKLPAAAAEELNTLGRAALGADTAVPQGLTAMVRGARSGGEAMAAFAQTLGDAALLGEVFPDGLAPETAAAAEAFRAAAGGRSDFAARLLALARQMAAAPEGDAALLAAARELLAALPPETAAPTVQGDLAKASAALARSLPESVREAAVFQNMPELEKALVWQKVADSLPWLRLPADSLRQAGHTAREMAAAVAMPAQAATETAAGQQVLVMTMPIFFADGHVYPAYIHVSRDREQAGGGATAAAKDTWLRMCVATDNLGVVDMVFHLYDQEQLSIRVVFNNTEAGEEFRRALPDLRGALADSPLTLTDIAVVASAANR
jgi:hypothetical protein